MRLLVVEDDAGIAKGLLLNLRQRKYSVDWATGVATAWAVLRSEPIDLMLLDLGLPDGDGGDLLRRLRESTPGPGQWPDPHLPVLVLTARDQVTDRVAGLELGADDYLVKPFDVDELVARIRSLLRRSAGRTSSVIRYGDLEVHTATHQVRKAGLAVDLGAREFALLQDLLDARGQIMSKQRLEQALYSADDAVESNAIEVHIHHLRRKLGASLIRTMRGVGYFIPREDE
jgi:DNA-binding response OmpR family regulator